jgi:DNA-binding XRE family transcriptional regulator
MITKLSYNESVMRDWTPEDIKELRARFGITQKALADLLGVTRVYVGLLERNEKQPSKTLKLALSYIERKVTEKENGKTERR